MHSGKKPQCILVKSDEFENSYSLYILLKSCLCCCSLATLAAQQQVLHSKTVYDTKFIVNLTPNDSQKRQKRQKRHILAF